MNMEEARFNMIEQQIRPCDILDGAVLQTISDLPRDAFVEVSQRALAYADIQLPLAHNERMMHPRIEARILQELAIQSDDRCLEIGTGSGYLTACLANLSKEVYSIDIHPDFLTSAGERLSKQHISNVTLAKANGLQDLDQNQHFDVIVVTGAVPEYLPLFEKLLTLQGRLYLTVGVPPIQQAMLVTRAANDFVRTSLFETELNYLDGVVAPSHFTF